MTQQPFTYQKYMRQPPSQEEIQGLDEQRLESITGGGIVSGVKSLFKKTPKTNPYYDPMWRPNNGPSASPFTRVGMYLGEPEKRGEREERDE